MVPYWVREPIGRPRPFLMSSIPAITVVLTAPIPGRRTPSFPRAGVIVTCPCSIRTLLIVDRSMPSQAARQQAREGRMIEQVTQVCKPDPVRRQDITKTQGRCMSGLLCQAAHATPLL